jgi:hypothetical protein
VSSWPCLQKVLCSAPLLPRSGLLCLVKGFRNALVTSRGDLGRLRGIADGEAIRTPLKIQVWTKDCAAINDAL